MKGVILQISGYVQGVGYRQFVKKQARRLGLTGWVQNMPDRTVEAKAFGDTKQLEAFILQCKKGAFLSEVKDVQVTWIEEESIPEDFSILQA